jgi:hypothetical protein
VLLVSDDYEVIEILDSSEEEEDSDDDDDVEIVCCITPAKKQQQQQRRQSARQQSQQKQQQQQQQAQQLQQPPCIIQMYVDGSYRLRVTPKHPIKMAGGVYAAGGRLSMSRILQGGAPDSCRAELGTIYAAIEHLATAGLAGLLPGKLNRTAVAAGAGAGVSRQGQQQQQQQTAAGLVQQVAAEVHILTDCQSCLDMIVVRDRVKAKYGALVRAIKQMKAALPFVVRICKVKGHSKAKDAHAFGNDRAHQLAYRCSAHQPVCKLPA